MPIPPLVAKIEVDDTQANKEIDEFARDTGKKIDQIRLIELRANTDSLDLKLFKLREELKRIKAEGKDGVLDERAFKRVSAEIRTTSSELTEAKRKVQNLRNTGDETTSRLQAKFDKLGGSIGRFKTQVLSSIGAFIGFRQIGGFLGDLADATDSFESAFAGFRKTLEATEPELVAIENGIKRLSQELPLTTEELSKIAETGGQFGIAAQDILIFTETVGKLSTAISGVSAEEASKQLAIVLSLTGDSIQNIDKLSSSLVELGNNFKANEGQILNFAERIAGSAGVIGITSDQVLAISAAFVDAGIEAEAGGTAVNKVFDQLNFAAIKGGEELTKFATIAGLSAEQFVKDFEKDPAKVFSDFVDGLSKSGKEAALVLDDLGLKDARLRRAFLSTAKAGGTLQNALESASDEFSNATALNEEFEKRLNTNTAQLKIQANQWRLWKASVGESTADARVSLGEFALRFVPFAFASLKLDLASLAAGFTVLTASIIRDIGSALIGIKGLGLGFFEIVKNIGVNSGILATNIGVAFSRIPGLVGGAIDSVAGGIEGLLNGALNGLEKFVNGIANSGINKLLKENLGIGLDAVDFGAVSIGRLGIGQTGGEFAEFVKLSEGRISQINSEVQAFRSQKDSEIAAVKSNFDEKRKLLDAEKNFFNQSQEEATQVVENETKAQIQAENEALQDYIDGLSEGDEATGKSANNRKASKGSANNQIEKAEKELNKKLAEDAKELEKIKKEELKATTEFAKEQYSEQVDEVKELEDSLRENIEAVSELREEYKELRDDAVDALQDINQELKELDRDEDVSLAERQLEIQEERIKLAEELGKTTEDAVLKELDAQLEGELSQSKRERLEEKRAERLQRILEDLQFDNRLTGEQAELKEKILELDNERALIEENITEAVLNEAKAYEELNEAEKILFDNTKARRELQEQALVQTAVQEGRDIQIIQDDENGVKALVENEKGELIELENFKNTQDAIELQNQRALLQSKELALLDSINAETVLLRNSYAEKAELEQFYTGIIDIETTKRIKINDKYIKQLQKVISLQREAGVVVPNTSSSNGEAITTNNITNNIEVNNATAGAAVVSTQSLINNITAL